MLSKSNCFRTVELNVFQLIVTLFHLIALTELILYYFNLLYYWSNWTENFFCIYYRICSTPSKNPDCKIKITVKKNFNLKYVISIFLFIDNVSNVDCQILQYCDNLRKVVGATLCDITDIYSLVYLLKLSSDYPVNSDVTKY